MKSIFLIGCAKRKRRETCAASELYMPSLLFQRCRAFAELHADRWFILSAKHGLLSPDDVIAPYDESLNTMFSLKRYEWAMRVFSQIKQTCRQPAQERIVILAGRKYREHLLRMLEKRGHQVECPLAAMRGIGIQIRFLNQAIAMPEIDHPE